MIRIISFAQTEEWDALVRSFSNYDIYYLTGYVHAFQIHGDGEPMLVYYEGDGLRGLYVCMKRTTAFEGVYDTITPYGYGGFLLEGEATAERMQCLWSEYVAKMREMHVVDNFVRYHPVLANAAPMKLCSEVIDLGKTIAIDLTSEEVIWTNFHTKNRNMIRKAEKNGVEIHHAQNWSLFHEFIKVYNESMDRDHAEEYYYFDEAFYRSIHEDLAGQYEMFYATYQGQIIAMSIMLYANGRMHYHLSGSLTEFRTLAPTNLLLYKAALWGCEQGFKTLHMGGGVGSGEDNLYKFKAGFNKLADYTFSIAKQVFDEEMYQKLVEERAGRDPKFDRTSGFFPVYRA
jgi:hypothetical protein